MSYNPGFRAYACAVCCVAFIIAPIAYIVYLATAARWEKMTGTAGGTGFLLYLLTTFVLPLSVTGIFRLISRRLVRLLSPRSIFPVAVILMAGWSLFEIPRIALEDGPKFRRMAASLIGIGMMTGILFGTLEEARKVWQHQVTPGQREEP